MLLDSLNSISYTGVHSSTWHLSREDIMVSDVRYAGCFYGEMYQAGVLRRIIRWRSVQPISLCQIRCLKLVSSRPSYICGLPCSSSRLAIGSLYRWIPVRIDLPQQKRRRASTHIVEGVLFNLTSATSSAFRSSGKSASLVRLKQRCNSYSTES